MLAGGLRHRPERHFNAPGARSQATMLTLAAIALVLPAAYQRMGAVPELPVLSLWIALVLIGVYASNLLFSLGTHRALFAGSTAEDEGGHAPAWSTARAGLVLAGATAAITWMSEILVGALEPATHALGLNDVFVGVFVVAILGNAAEHATAVTAAMKNRSSASRSSSRPPPRRAEPARHRARTPRRALFPLRNARSFS
jgi:Ca2+:H+ antiporter